MALTCLPLSLLPEPPQSPPPFRFAEKERQKPASAMRIGKSQALPREGRHAKRNLRLTRAHTFPCPQTYGLRNTSVPSIATEPGRPAACQCSRPQRQAGNRFDREPARIRAEGFGRRRRFQRRKSHAGGVRGKFVVFEMIISPYYTPPCLQLPCSKHLPPYEDKA